MPDHNPAGTPLPDDEPFQGVAGLPSHLPGAPRRQAVYSIRGTVYQAWCSIDAWLQLNNADSVIYLEGAEDFEIIKHETAITVQVKHTTESISLGSRKAREALDNYWALCCNNPSRRIDFHYLTTSTIATEQSAPFDGLNGIQAWRAARTNPDLAIKIAAYLIEKLPPTSPLRAFLASSTPAALQEQLIRRFYWLTEQPGIEAVKRSVNDRICVLLSTRRISLTHSSTIEKFLVSHFWQTIEKLSPTERCLTHGALLGEIEAATTVSLAIPIDQLADLIGNAHPGLNLLKLLIQKSPQPPNPLLQRPALTHRLKELVNQRQVILLTGSVYKGKTTLAQLVMAALCPEAWWVNLTERKPNEVDNLLLALAGQIESGDCPNLVVLDDLDISPTAHRAYKDSLSVVLHRANATGRGIILTAQGASSDSAVMLDFNNIQLLDVPELTSDQIETLCLEHGCPNTFCGIWATLMAIWTRGHPQLVQARLTELIDRGWPEPSATELTTQPSAVTSIVQLARQHLSGSVSDPVAEFVYIVSECSVLMHRSIAIRLAESIPGVGNAGDLLDKLTGKWLERIEGSWFRTTALLKGAAKDVWSPEKYRLAHVHLHDAIRAKATLDPLEAAALLFHAFMGQDRARLAHTAIHLQTIHNDDVSRTIDRQLLWLPFVALQSGQSITADTGANVILRQLQFRVASTLDSDTLPQICERWAADIKGVPVAEVRPIMSALMWSSIGFSQSLKIPLQPRLQAIVGVETLPTNLQDFNATLTQTILGRTDEEVGIPAEATTIQLMLLFTLRSIRGISLLEELLSWLDTIVSEDIRQQFDAMLDWTVVQALGAFVHGAWSFKHEETQDWESWVAIFTRIDEYAVRRTSPRFGREAAKAKATILTEYLDRDADALTVLDQADATFGSSAVLLEHRANVLFHRGDDETVLNIWSHLTSDPASTATLDPFAYRRAGVSAARLKRWSDAEQIFLAAINSITPGSFECTKFGLQVDAALVMSLGGNQIAAAKLLAEAVLALPSAAATEGDLEWDFVQRFAVEVCRSIENAYWKQEMDDSRVQVGNASSPALRTHTPEPGQALRNEMTRVQVIHLASTLGVVTPAISQAIETLAASKFVYVRWFASESRLALSCANGGGAGFIRALIAFETAWVDRSTNRERIREPVGPPHNLAISPERWVGLLVAGIVCSSPDLLSNLAIWGNESSQELGAEASLTNVIGMIADGASRPEGTLEATVKNTTSPVMVRCGAAAQLLVTMPAASLTFQLQRFLTSVIAGDVGSMSRQDLFNLHIARRFAIAWRHHSENRFQFFSPLTYVPALLHAVDDVASGTGGGSLRRLLQAAADGLGQPSGSFMDRVL